MKIQDTFNSGAQYTPEGQIISYYITGQWEILFKDHSRMITGKLDMLPDDIQFEIEECNMDIRHIIMREYLHNRYSYDIRANRLVSMLARNPGYKIPVYRYVVG